MKIKTRSSIILFLMLLPTFFTSCGTEEALKQEFLDDGLWRGVLRIQDQELPFNFEVEREDSVTYHLYIINGRKRIEIRGLAMQGDSVFIPMHIYDAVIKARLNGKKMTGVYQKNYKENSSIPFEATHKTLHRFDQENRKVKVDVSGLWKVSFKDGDTVQTAVGIFQQDKNKVEGTFLTPQGDLGYLEGTIKDSTLWLSSFNGVNSFLFKGNIQKGTEISGHFWDGAYDYKLWTAEKNDRISGPVLMETNFEKANSNVFKFRFTDLNGKLVSLSDSRYNNKVKIVHVFGSWNTNSVEQVKFLADFYKENKGKEIAVIGLGFEQKDDFNYAKFRINKMASRLGATFDFLIAGTASTESIEEKIPVLQGLASFPATLFIDKKNRIRRIENGYASPASGLYHHQYKNRFNFYIDQLLAEDKETEIVLK